MAAYELFAATTTDLFIANIKDKAEAYGWTIDFFGTYSSHNRLHLHNSAGSHFEIWYASASACYVRGCTGYSSTDTPLAQPGTSGTVTWPFSTYWHFIIIGPLSIYIKSGQSPSYSYNVQIGTIVEKVGAWGGGHCVSSSASNTSLSLWSTQPTTGFSQVYINGGWSTLLTTAGGAVKGTCESELYTKMPFAYSGGIMPVPMLLVQLDPTTPSNLHPIGYAPDVAFFRGGDVYQSLTPVTINGESWLPFNSLEQSSITADAIADTLVRLAA